MSYHFSEEATPLLVEFTKTEEGLTQDSALSFLNCDELTLDKVTAWVHKLLFSHPEKRLDYFFLSFFLQDLRSLDFPVLCFINAIEGA